MVNLEILIDELCQVDGDDRMVLGNLGKKFGCFILDLTWFRNGV